MPIICPYSAQLKDCTGLSISLQTQFSLYSESPQGASRDASFPTRVVKRLFLEMGRFFTEKMFIYSSNCEWTDIARKDYAKGSLTSGSRDSDTLTASYRLDVHRPFVPLIIIGVVSGMPLDVYGSGALFIPHVTVRWLYKLEIRKN